MVIFPELSKRKILLGFIAIFNSLDGKVPETEFQWHNCFHEFIVSHHLTEFQNTLQNSHVGLSLLQPHFKDPE